LITQSTTRTRLCPYCANSIEEEATNCPYCKADLLSDFVPQWLKRDEPALESRPASKAKRLPTPSKFIWAVAMLVVALAAFFTGGYLQRKQLLLSSQDNIREIQAKDQMIQSLEKQLAQSRQELNENSSQLADAKTKVEESQKNLSTMQQRLEIAKQQADRLAASRAQPITRTVSRPADVPPPAPAPARRAAETGVYETTRATTLYEDPSGSSRVVSQINKGTRINVVRSVGDWLEVRSKRGNPPGYMRSDDARPLTRSN